MGGGSLYRTDDIIMTLKGQSIEFAFPLSCREFDEKISNNVTRLCNKYEDGTKAASMAVSKRMFLIGTNLLGAGHSFIFNVLL